MMISIYIRGDIHNDKTPFYANSCELRLETPSYDTSYITQHALKAFNSIYRKGYQYRKAGVVLSHLVDSSDVQLNLFDKVDIDKQRRLMNALDTVNKYCGKGTLILGAQGLDKKWAPRKEHIAPRSSALRIYSGMPISSPILNVTNTLLDES